MAERRMFAKTIIDSDAFLEMPSSARLLYFDLGMRADDDGFVNSPKKIMRITGSTEDDMKILIMKKFIIPFENGIVVIKHWRINNYLRKDRYNETQYIEEKERLTLDEKGKYHLKNPSENNLGIPTVDTGKVRLGKDRLNNSSGTNSTTRFKKPSLEEVQEYVEANNLNVDPSRFIDYYESNGWKVGKNSMKDWKATVRNWSRKDNFQGKQTKKVAPLPAYRKESEVFESDEYKQLAKEIKNDKR